MADAAIGVVMETLLNRVVSLAAEEINLARGVNNDLKKLAKELEMIQAQLSDAQSKQITDKRVQLWLERLGSVALDIQIVLDEFGYQVLRQKIECRRWDKVRHFFSTSNPLIYRLRIAHKIKDVMPSLGEVYEESTKIGLREVIKDSTPYQGEQRSTVPFVDDSEIVGRDDDTSKLINMLVGSEYPNELPVIAIQGMGGGGKTTLAQLVFKTDEVQSYFDKRVWVCVSEDFKIQSLLAEMLQFLTGTNQQLTNAGALVGKLKEQLSGKRYLLVLDDVWDRSGEMWEHMRGCLLEIGGSNGSKVLITTRHEEVVSAMQTSRSHQLQVLSEQQSWELFEKWAFADSGAKNSQKMVEIGKRILKRCGGVPLAIRVIGGLLSKKNNESEWAMIERSELWSDSVGGERVSAAIKLSYYHLPALSLKQCFAYCAIFKKDERIEKDNLIQLWMAQGLLNAPKGSGLEMEEIGSDYFNSLLRSSLLQGIEKDDYNNITHCKMHDLVHDVSLQVSKNYCFHANGWKDVKDKIQAVHLSIIATEEEGLPKSLKDIVPSKLRTLHLEGGCYMLEDLFANFKFLTVFILKDDSISELPKSISKIKHLRFFDISFCWGITRLPKSFTELYHLQTLKVYRLDEIPKGFWKLINLRHIFVRKSSVDLETLLIPRLSQLTNLQTLPVDKWKGCQIEELEHLNNLTGKLNIYCLQNVSTRESALKSKLSRKSKVQTLYLHWDDEREEDCDDGDVTEGLKPHSNLKSLTIVGYQSPRFPSWMTARNEFGNHLVKLILKKLNRCEQLPSLGVLPCLEHLEIWGLENVRRIGEEFYGWSNLDWFNCSNGSQITLFPSLKVFKLSKMRSLEEWSDAIVPAHAHSSSSIEVFPVLEEMEIEELSELCYFPNLGCLPKLRRLVLRKLQKCEQLPSLGVLPCLEHLEISGLENVRFIGEEFYGWSNLDWVKKSNCCNGSQITIFPSLKVFKLREMRNLEEWSYAIVPAHAHSSSVEVFPVLEEMEIEELPELCSFPNLGCLPKLGRLSIRFCARLNWNGFGTHPKSEIEDEMAASVGVGPSSSFCPPHDDLVVNVPNVHYLPSLRHVTLWRCDKFAAPFCSLKILAPLESLSIRCDVSLLAKDLHHLINLRSLTLQGYASEPREVDCFPFPCSISNVTEDVQCFASLRALSLSGLELPNVRSLPDQIQYLTSLRDLTIYVFYRLEALPEWLGNLTSLQILRVWFCVNLKQLPSAEAFQRLINLQRLLIAGCSKLKEACTQGSGSEWPKIALIPNLKVDMW